MVAWPAGLPQIPLSGVTAGDDDSVLRSPMDSGPPTRRNRFTAITQSLEFPMIMTGTERATFDTFYRTTIANGSLSFDWEDPLDDSTVSMAFKAPPRWSLLVGSDTAADRRWSSTFSLEIQP